MRFKDAILEVRERADIATVVGQHLELKRAGRNFKGLCPFHAEKTPSFMVSPEKQLFHCFGCGQGGSVFDFLMKVRNVSFVEALQHLASRVGVVIDEDYADPQAAQNAAQAKKERDEFAEINQEVCNYFQQNLLHPERGSLARGYLLERGVNEAAIKQFRLGLAEASWDALAHHLSRKGLALKRAVELGLIAPREAKPEQPLGFYDKYRARLIFPIVDLNQRVVGFGGRVLPGLELKRSADFEEAKYINSAQSPLFDKSKTFYLLDQAAESIRKEKFVVIVEGYMDALSLHQAGITNVVATLGTALTPMHGRVLARFTDRVVTLFDGDTAGQRAALRSLAPLLQAGLDAKIALLPSEQDPDTYVRTQGVPALRELFNNAEELLAYCTKQALNSATSQRERALALEEIVQAISRVPNRLQRELWLQQLSTLTGLSLPVLTRSNANSQADNSNSPVQSSALTAIQGEEALLLCLMFENSDVYSMLKTYEGPTLIVHPLLAEIMQEQLGHTQKSAGDLAAVMDSIQDEALKQHLQKRLFDLEAIAAEEQLKAARDCIRKILRKRFEGQLRQLSEQISQAQNRQDDRQVLDLLRQKKELLNSAPSDI